MFNQNDVTKLNIPRSYKEINPVVTTTLNTGDFVPFFNMEIIPNDNISLSMATVTNMTTPNYATMDTLYQHIAWFYAPNRLVWENWDKFYGEGKNADYETFVQKFVPQLKCPSGSNDIRGAIGITDDPTKSGIVADLSLAEGITVREFKKLLMAQQIAQNIEDGGSRYIEQLYKRWGVKANELELEIPKFLGSRTTILNMNMIVGTGAKPTSGTSDYEFGQLTGMSNTYDDGHIFTYRFKQHGYLFGIVTIRPYNTYENGIPKQLVKHSIDDYYKPEMAYLGPDEIKNYEIYSDSSDGKDDEMFGVRNYGDDLRYIPNRVTGGMRTNATFSQAYKTYSINYSTRPVNNEDFILQSVKQVDKTLTTESTEMDQFIFQAKMNIKMVRNLPKNPQAEQLIRL